jgi:lysophospholipase L1-like esterase
MRSFKRIIVFLLALPMLFSAACRRDEPAAGPGSGEGGSNDGDVAETKDPDDLTAYDEEKYLRYFWEGGKIYNESLLPLEDQSGHFDPAGLLYGIKKIISVRNSGLDIQYEEGRDYLVTDGKFLVVKGGLIPSVRYDEYFLAAPNEPLVPLGCVYGGFLRYDELFFHQKQISITYEAEGAWQGAVPVSKTGKLPKTTAKLNAKEPLSVVCIGDSIIDGASASGHPAYHMPPYMPVWPDMGFSALKKAYGYDAITVENLAVGGAALLGAGENDGEAQLAKALAKAPDLLVVGFGNNDCGSPVTTFMPKLNDLIARVRTAFPNCEILLVSPLLRNNLETYSNQTFNNNLNAFTAAMLGAETSGVAVVNVLEVQKAMLSGKTYRYYDYTGNNINHPNDFLTRAYAQVLLKALGV